MAKYKKKRARELKQDKFRDSTMRLLDQLGNRLEGKGRSILYGIAAVLILVVLVSVFVRWRSRKAQEASHALGRAIAIATTPVSSTPSTNPGTPNFSSEQERAQKAIDEFQKVAATYGDPYRTEARYFIATNLLIVDRNKGISELADLAKSSDHDVAALAKFALGQAKEADGKYDEAAALYRELAGQNTTVVTPESANLRLALVYEKQGKKKEAADLLFNIVDAARKAKGSEDESRSQSQAARDAAQELQKIDPDRYAQLPPEAPPNFTL